MRRPKPRLLQILEYAAIVIVALPFRLLPRRLALRAGELLGELMYRSMRGRRALGLKNLTIAFGASLSDAEKQRILRATFRNLGKSVVEVLHFPGMSNAYLREKVEFVGAEHYITAMSKGRGLIFLSGHVGNWEMSSHAWSAAGHPVSIVVRPLDNTYLNNFVTRLRTMHGNRLLARSNGLKQILAALRRGEAVGILMDQNTMRSRGIFVDFFGKPACTVPVIALLALRYRVPVIPGFIVRTGFDTHTLIYGPEIEIERTGDTQKDIARNTAKFNQIIEDFIRQYPDQWFWLHNRWKNQPR